MRTYFSTKRDQKYTQDLQAKTEASIIELKRMECYTAMIYRVVSDQDFINQCQSKEALEELFQSAILAQVDSYNSRTDDGSAGDNEEIREGLVKQLGDFLKQQLQTNNIISDLTQLNLENRHELDQYIKKAKTNRDDIADLSEAAQSILEEHRAYLMDCKEALQSHEIAKKTPTKETNFHELALEKSPASSRDKYGKTLLEKIIATKEPQLLAACLYSLRSQNINFNKIIDCCLTKAVERDDPDIILNIANNINLDLKTFFTADNLENHPNTLAYLIRHDDLCNPSVLRQALENSYLSNQATINDTVHQEPLNEVVKKALQEKYDFYQRADRVASFYKDASLHVIEKSQSVSDENKEIYKNKLEAISTQIADTLNEKSLPDLSAQAGEVADKLLSNTNIQKNTGFFRPCCGLNKTQTEINNRQKALRWGPKQRELDRKTREIPDYLTMDILNQIPLSKDEREACAKRAVEARAVFKETLDYLSKRYDKDDHKLKILEQRIDYYISGKGPDNQPYNAETFIQQLQKDQNDYSNLGDARNCWTKFFKKKTTTIKKLEQASLALKAITA